MKLVKLLLLLAVIGFVSAVGINIYNLNKLDKAGEFDKNAINIGLEAAKRLNPGLLSIIGGVMSGDFEAIFGGEERVNREINNVICDWYATIKWSPVLNVSKEIRWMMVR